MKQRILIIGLVLAMVLVGCRQQAPLTSEDIQVDLSVEPDPPAVGEAALIVNVSDPDGNPLDVASITVRGDMDHAGMVPVIESLEDGTGGSYELPFEWSMGGDWVIEVTVELPDGAATSETFEYTLEGESMDMDEMDIEMTDEAGDMVMDVTGDDMEDMTGMDADMPDMQMGGTSAVYMTITNNGDVDVVMIGGSANVAGDVQLHETVIEDGVARMVEQGDGIFIPAGETVSLQPGGLHVMLVDLQGDLVEADTFNITFNFDNGEVVTLEPLIQTEAPQDSDTSASIEAGDLVIEGVWARPSTGGMTADMGDDSEMEMEATEESE